MTKNTNVAYLQAEYDSSNVDKSVGEGQLL